MTTPALSACGTVESPDGAARSRAYPEKSFVILLIATSHPEPQSPSDESATSTRRAAFIATPSKRQSSPAPAQPS